MISRTRLLRRRFGPPFQRLASSQASNEVQQGWLFADSVFPIHIAKWDFRHYIGLLREEDLLDLVKSRLEEVTAYDFKVVSLEPHEKDGGVFVRFSYSAKDQEAALTSIQSELFNLVERDGGFPSWLGLNKGRAWVVKGTPWREDMDRYASPVVKVTFEGPNLQEQTLYQLFRPFGHIRDLTSPAPVPSSTLRSSTIIFSRIHSATIARNVLHGFSYTTTDETSKTLLRTAYQRPVQAHAIRDWMSSHPKIMLPLIVFLIGTLTYTVFDPIRSLMIQGKMLDWFDYREFRLYKWLRTNAFERFYLSAGPAVVPAELSTGNIWKERNDAIGAIKSYLSDLPSTIEFIHGPQGSGKTIMLEAILRESNRTAMIIDCRLLHNSTSDSQIVASLASQTGYRPVFTFLNSLNNLIDLASVGLIGQKAGLSSSLDDQLRQILAVVKTALRGVSSSHRANTKQRILRMERQMLEKEEEERIRGAIKSGVWHDGRLDCVAGNGIMSELGIGDEPVSTNDRMDGAQVQENLEEERNNRGMSRKQITQEELDTVRSLPIVVLRDYASNIGTSRDEVLTVLAEWAASLVESQVAHVIVISDNRENAKYLAKALPSKPLSSIVLSDADPGSSVSFVKQKLLDVDIKTNFTPKQVAYVERLGGRASDLEILVHRVRNGLTVEDAVESIIARSVVELRKNAFGDDVDVAKSLPWTREQVWVVLKLLSKREEIPYHELLFEFPFKGDETALRSMEHAEIISIGTHEGRPSTIRPGKPVLRWVFDRLVKGEDPIFRATQEIVLNEKIIANAEKTIKACEEELTTISTIASQTQVPWWKFGFGESRGTSARSRYLADKVSKYAKKIGVLEKQNTELKKVLAKGDIRDEVKKDTGENKTYSSSEEDENLSKSKKRKIYKSAEFIEDSSDLEELPEIKPKAVLSQKEPPTKMVKPKEVSLSLEIPLVWAPDTLKTRTTHVSPPKRRRAVSSDSDSTPVIPSRSNSKKLKIQEEVPIGDGDIAAVSGHSPKSRQKPRASVEKPSDKKSTRRKGSKSEPSDKHEATIKKLKSLVNACGVRKPWVKIFKDLPKPTQQIAKLREILSELGMTGRLSMEQAKRIKAERELAQELEDVQSFEHEMLNRSQRRVASTSCASTKRGESEDDESEDDVQHRRQKVHIVEF
ncbi:hypothetical protein H0H92_005447 [Tricholoma furcatifolium]|nr:hypothetical protein H0H92_005447 [Tricholoma furcatifolium]